MTYVSLLCPMTDFENRYYACSKLSKQKNFYIPNQMMTVMYPIKLKLLLLCFIGDQMLKQLLKLVHTINLVNSNELSDE